jgi:hypothetical protein
MKCQSFSDDVLFTGNSSGAKHSSDLMERPSVRFGNDLKSSGMGGSGVGSSSTGNLRDGNQVDYHHSYHDSCTLFDLPFE